MRILSSQLAHLGQGAARAFTARMAAYLREAYPHETERMTGDALDAWIERNVARAKRGSIDTEPEVAQYLLLCLLLGDDAPERLAWFRAPLDDARLVAEGKVRAVVRAARAAGVSGLDRFVMPAFAN